ncbi:phenylalanine--tRNA ligase subunit beta [Metamycoplasma arthritidis]|uniref:phenylalanine--tRNA ligase n=1 Tax=Metamycoplasma arthritidis (strain 158L3-1) TaxID=243272 RepID=B3PM49_META1|nr:phenylalanine--tRNA ligase subunit beta [Metamycoplasma arthritidis]ACF07101.1 phenylalanyl-tRNA synthetase beta subunit [Metamycoplasma arthritidis 158L3-1]
MIFSYKKLVSLAHIEQKTIEEIVAAINSLGFEVEDYHRFSDVEGIKFGHVLKTYKNPNADRLTVCEIQFADGMRTIQTTATNVVDDCYLMAFVPGSRSKGITFAPKKMQGIVSDGMLASLSEVGFNEQVTPAEFDDQIFIFNEIDLNLDPIKYFDLDDYMIDVTILSNRADANSYFIMAKELAAYFNSYVDFKTENLLLPTTNHELGFSKKLVSTNNILLFEVNLESTDFSLQEQAFLWKHNISVNNWVENIANLTFLMTGIKPQVYDADKLKNRAFSTELYSGELTIKEQKIVLNKALVLKDGSQIIGLAGIAPFDGYQVAADTQRVLIEISSYDIQSVRKNLKQSHIETQQTIRNCKEINSAQLVLAYNYMTKNFNLRPNVSLYKAIPKQVQIKITNSYLNKYAGFAISKSKNYLAVIEKLKILGFSFSNNNLNITCPTYRYDLLTAQDFVEEFFRFYGYDNFPKKPAKYHEALEAPLLEDAYLKKLAAKNYINVRTFSLISPEKNIFNPFNFANDYLIPASKNYEHSAIRKSMIYSLSNVMLHNQKQGMKVGSYFEIGSISVDHHNVLGIVSNQKTFDEIKRDLISLTNKNLTFKKSINSTFHPNVNCEIYLENKMIGYIAKIHPNLLKDEAIYSEILLEDLSPNAPSFKTFNKLPLKSRDITINLQPNESIEATIDKLNQIKGIFQIRVMGTFLKEDKTKNVTLSILLEEWATKKFDKDFNEKQ